MSWSVEQREFRRLPIRLEVQVSDGRRTLVSGKTRDVSREGLYVFVDTPLPRGSECQVVLLVSGPKSQLRVEVSGKVVRTDDHGMAIDFTEVDLDSLFHLRNLIQYNMWLLGEEGQTI